MILRIVIIAAIIVILALIIKNLTKEPKEEYQSIDFNIRFKVTEIIDGDTFKVSPGWKWNNERGDIIRPSGYNTPEQGEPNYQEPKEKLTELILNKEVELKPIKLSYNRLLCEVFIDGPAGAFEQKPTVLT